MKYTPRAYQVEGAKFLSSRKYALLADACGVGKTGQALTAISHEWNILIVCPASVKNQWRQAFLDWRDMRAEVIEDSKQKFYGYYRVIVNYDLLIRDAVLSQLMAREWDLIVLDEGHKVKSVASKRTKCILGRKGLITKTKRMWFLTGTPVKNRPVDLYPILRACAPEVIAPDDNYLKFCFRYCGAHQTRFGVDVSGATHIEELGQKLKSFMLRREKRDVLTELPPRVVSKVELECSAAAKALIEEEEQATLEQAKDSDPSMFKLGEQVRIRKALAKHKVPGAIEYLKDLLEEENKIVVFYHHKEVLHELQKSTNQIKSVYIDGSVSPAKRGDIVRDFNQDRDVRLFFGQMEACGEGIDGLQNGASCAVFVEPSWSHTDIEQCIGRLERSGQRNDINVHILVIKDTIESRMMDTVAMKLGTDKRLYGTNNKQQEEKKMEDKKDGLDQATVTLVAALKGFVRAVALEAAENVKQLRETPATPVTAASAAPVKQKEQKEETPKAEEAVVVDVPAEEDVTEEAIRARCSDISAVAPGGKGKAACMVVIKTVGGGKIADLNTADQRVKALASLDTLYAQLSEAK
jgi:SWI/SNF-related matrix-associated actin-dependent regulator 1 of chromatin subfamily A